MRGENESLTKRVEISWKMSITCRAWAAFACLSCRTSASEGMFALRALVVRRVVSNVSCLG